MSVDKDKTSHGRQLHFIHGLKSRQDDVRLRAARDLHRFVSTELRELPTEDYGSVLDEINQSIFSLISSAEVHEKKGGILAIGEKEKRGWGVPSMYGASQEDHGLLAVYNRWCSHRLEIAQCDQHDVR